LLFTSPKLHKFQENTRLIFCDIKVYNRGVSDCSCLIRKCQSVKTCRLYTCSL